MKAEQAKMKAEQALVRAWSVIYHHLNYNNNEDEDLRGEIWKYIEDNKIELYKECEFETTISTTELAHYTPNGLYYGSIDELGDEPVKVRMPFKITREMFDIDLSMFLIVDEMLQKNCNFEFEYITELFEPKDDWFETKDDWLTPF